MQQSHPKVSIIIPVYNGANYIREAIDSALNQTYKYIEVIVVNDGSRDNTEEIALSYGDRIRYFSKENGGVASALNMGIRVMEGDYFSWLSHDDVYLADKIKSQIDFLEKEGDPFKIVFGSWMQKSMETNSVRKNPPEYRFSIQQMQSGVFPVLFGQVNGCTMLIHKSHFDRVGLFDESLLTSQDYDFWLRLMRGELLAYRDDCMVVQRIHEMQGSNTIPEFKHNCEELQISMVNNLTEREIKLLFGSRYKLYYDMLVFSENNQWGECEKEFYSRFLKEEPKGRLFHLDKKNRDRLILYCAGKNGVKLKKELYMRGIDMDFFCDSKSEYFNQYIDGKLCLSPQMLTKNDYIIVTKDYPEDVVLNLKKKGFQNVIAYSEIANELFMSVPFKDRVVKYYGEKL